MLYNLSALSIQLNSLYYTTMSKTSSVWAVKSDSEDEEEKEKPKQLTEDEVLTILLYEQYDEFLTVNEISQKYGLNDSEASSVLRKYKAHHEAQQQVKINQNPPKGETITYIS